MPNSIVLYMLGWALFCLALLLGAASLGALALGEPGYGGRFFIDMCICGFVAGALVLGFGGRKERMSRPQMLGLVVLVWTVLPLFAMAPFLSHHDFGSLTRAVFESVSGVTTTGASLVTDYDALPASLALWRALLQWFGGALTLVTAVVALAPLGVLSTPINITIPGYEKDDPAKSAVATARHILPAYVLCTLICMGALWVAQVPPFEALCLAFSTLSTGGFVPVEGGVGAYDTLLGEAVLMAFMVIGATSFLAHRAVLLRVAGTHRDNRESWYLIYLILIGAVVLAAVLSPHLDDGQMSWPELVRYAVFRAVSMITTSGFDNAPAELPGVPFVLVCTACAIGGASFSTAGGLKIFRVFSMLTQAHRELKRLIHPRSITKAKSTGKPIDVQIMKTIWSTFFLFVFSVALVSIVLAVEGVAFDSAVVAAMSVMSNSGHALDLASHDAVGAGRLTYAQMSTPSLWALMAGMVLGRIEFAVVLSLVYMVVLRR